MQGEQKMNEKKKEKEKEKEKLNRCQTNTITSNIIWKRMLVSIVISKFQLY